MYKKITRQHAREIVIQIRLAKMYAMDYAKQYGKNANEQMISILRQAGLEEAALHASFLTYGAMTLGKVMTLLDGPIPLNLVKRLTVQQLIDSDDMGIRFDRGQAYYLKREGKLMGIKPETGQMYVFSFKEGWQVALLESMNDFKLRDWMTVFPVENWGLYVPNEKIGKRYFPTETFMHKEA